MVYKRVILDTAEIEREEIVRYLVEDVGSAQAAANFLSEMDREVNLISETPRFTLYLAFPRSLKKGTERPCSGAM